jgi:hypothetical protein
VITPKTRDRLLWLSRWNPPPGITRMHVIHDDGSITVHLESERYQESLSVCPCCPADGVPDLLDEIAVGLLAAERREAKQPERKAEARVERQLARADSAFRKGLKRATRKRR